MKAQFENEVMTSLMLYVDHYIMEKGQAYTNNNSSFYKIDEDYTDYQVWAAPYKQLVCDHSVNGATVISGAYINGSASYTTPSEGPSYQDMEFVNQYQGQIYFKANPSITPINAVSGSYSVKDFNVYLTNENEEELLFETQFDLRPKVSQTPTGLASEKQTFPAVIVRQKYPVRRLNGVRVTFEDNAAVIVTPEGELKGTDIKGPVGSEAAERWPRIANAANIII